MKLYEIADELEMLMNEIVNPETGEIAEEDMARLDELELAKADKVLACAAYYKGVLAEAEAVKAEKQKLARRQRIHENQAERMRAYIESCLEEDEKFSDGRSKLGWRKSTRVVFEGNPEHLPERLRKTTHEARLKEIGNDLKAGVKVTNAWLDTRKRLSIS